MASPRGSRFGSCTYLICASSMLVVRLHFWHNALNTRSGLHPSLKSAGRFVHSGKQAVTVHNARGGRVDLFAWPEPLSSKEATYPHDPGVLFCSESRILLLLRKPRASLASATHMLAYSGAGLIASIAVLCCTVLQPNVLPDEHRLFMCGCGCTSRAHLFARRSVHYRSAKLPSQLYGSSAGAGVAA